MSLTCAHDNAIIADPRFVHASIQAGVGHYLLAFTIRFDTAVHRTGTYRLTSLQAKVQMTAPGKPAAMLGRAEVDSTAAIRADQFRHDADIIFELRLIPQQLQALEDIRDGGDLRFTLRISGQATKLGIKPAPAHEQVEAPVSQSEWIKELNNSGFSSSMLLEVPLTPTGSSKVADQLLRARELYLAGHYDQVVAQCRKVLEALDDVNPASTAKVDQLFQNGRGTMSAKERLQFLRDVARHYTHPAHHADDKAVSASYSRKDAGMIMSITAALAAHAATATP
jgi:hypothetical protein